MYSLGHFYFYFILGLICQICHCKNTRYYKKLTVSRDIIKSYKQAVVTTPTSTLLSLPKQERGAKPLLPNEIDQKLIDMMQ